MTAKGQTLSINARLAIMEWHATHGSHFSGKRGDNHVKSRAVLTPDGRFGSAALAAEHYGISRSTASYRAHNECCGWQWEDVKSRAVLTPDGRFDNATLAAEHYGISRRAGRPGRGQRAAAVYRADNECLGWRWDTEEHDQ
jgi:hypothetical protein